MTWDWDTRHNLTAVHGREAGTDWSIATDSAHHFPLAVTDANSVVHPAPGYSNDGKMNVESITDIAGGNTASYTYYNNGLPETTTDRNGKITTFYWTPEGNLDTIIDATSRSTWFTYDDAGRRTSAQADGGPLYAWVYDDADRITDVYRDSDLIQHIDWVDNPQTVTVTDAIGYATLYTYDAAGRLESVGDDGHTNDITYQYGGRGEIWRVTDRASRVVERLYTAAGQLWKLIEPDPGGGANPLVTEYWYNDDGSLAWLKDPGAKTTYFEWDPDTLTKTTTLPDSTTEIETFDVKGRLTCFTNRAGQDREKEYDDWDRLTTQACPTCGATFDYDNEGRLRHVYDAVAGDGNAATADFEFVYDDAGRLLEEKQPGVSDNPAAVSVSHTYDDAGRPETMTWPDSTSATYAYDAKGRLETITRGSGGGAQTWTYDYLANDLRNTLTLPNGTVCYYDYDSAHRPYSLTWVASNSTVLNEHYYDWNEADEITRHAQTNAASGTRDYTHDAVSRLHTSTPSGGLFSGELARTWNYDANGNRTSVVTGTGGGATTVAYTLKSGEWNLYDTVGSATMGAGTGVSVQNLTKR